MKKSLFLLLLIAHFCSAVSRAQEPLAIHLKDFHTAPNTDVLVDTDKSFIYIGTKPCKTMKNSLSLLLMIAHFCRAGSRAQEPLAIHLKDFHTAPITDVLVDTDERFIYSGDQSGKILVTRTLDYGFHKTLLKRADGMAIKDMRLTNHDSILLILTGYRYALGRADSLLVFDTNRHQVARSMPVHDATFGSGTDGLLLLASGKDRKSTRLHSSH